MLYENFLIKNKMHRTELNLPISPVMTDEEVEKVVEGINKGR